MITYEIADEERTNEFTIIYVIMTICLFFAGKLVTFGLSKIFECTFTTWLNDGYSWLVIGILLSGFFIVMLIPLVYLQVKGEEWIITQHRFVNSDHWVVHSGGDHIISFFHKKIQSVKLFKKDGGISQEVKTLDGVLSITSTVTVEPISPLFILLDEKDAVATALKFGEATVESLIDSYTSHYRSETILKSGQKMTKWVQEWLDADEDLELLGIKVTMRVKKIDETKEVAESRTSALRALEFKKAVDGFAGVNSYLFDGDTGEIVLDKEGKPIMIPADIDREEGAIMLLPETKGKFNRTKDERNVNVNIQGNPETLRLLKFTGILNQDDLGGDQEGGNK